MKQAQQVSGSLIRSFEEVSKAHCRVVKLGMILETYTANTVVGGYAKCKELGAARDLFEEMPERDVASWNTMIGGYVNDGDTRTAWEALKEMKKCGFLFDEYTFGSVLKGIAKGFGLRCGQQVHTEVVKSGYQENVYAGSALLDMYAKCKRVDEAYAVFECMPDRNSVSWNGLIAGYAELGDYEMAIGLFGDMEREGFRIDDGTLAPLLALLNDPSFRVLTMLLHGKVTKLGLAFNTIVCNAMISSYSECGSLKDAKQVFDSMVGFQDLVTWNSLLAAYSVHQQGGLAMKAFMDMQVNGFEPDVYTFTSVISSTLADDCQLLGKSFHGMIFKKGLDRSVPISNALMALYLKSDNKSVEDALSIYKSMDMRDQVSWNSILTGFSQNGLSENALECFKQMLSELVEIDQYAFSAVFRACSDLATLQLGQQVHSLAMKMRNDLFDYVTSSLIFMYCKCGCIEDARKAFDETPQDTAIIWNSIIFGYAQHGQGYTSLDLFYSMRDRLVKPDHITFVAVLTACSHIGLLDEGCSFLSSMEADYGIPPRMEHYACAVDLCGRAGRLDRAEALIKRMPFEPDAMVWKTLLGACRMCGDIELASQAANRLLEMEPQEQCTYVLLSSIYSHLGRWNENADLKRLMKHRGVRKVPGWSWIELKNEVHSFNAADRMHRSSDEIYQVIDHLTADMSDKDKIDEEIQILDNEYH
uniref:Pentatricopeptide repeat-containing protein n=1 Tax=Kalanchoe fedtschenkoi TaxID=63787 RepID=A0A7N0V379_KALFE